MEVQIQTFDGVKVIGRVCRLVTGCVGHTMGHCSDRHDVSVDQSSVGSSSSSHVR